MDELLKQWSALKNQPSGLTTAGAVRERILREIQILEELRSAGCNSIEGEPFAVDFLLKDRRRVLREMDGRLSDLGL